MAKLKLKKDSSSLLTCVLYVLVGVLLIVLGATGLMNIMMTVAGVLFIGYGIYNIVMKKYPEGIIEAVIGVVIIVCGWTLAGYVLLVFGILLAVKGVYDIVNMALKHKLNNHDLIVAIITLVIGILLCVAPFAIFDIICYIVGAIFIINGVLSLFGKAE